MSVELNLPNGTYVAAISGGVDSVVLLDLLAKTESKIIIAHFDHGIRHNSHEDAEFVGQLAAKYNLPCEQERGELGPDASEADARAARYSFLHSVAKKHSAVAIITAHHQDDVIETSMINILRGTGRHGLTSLKSRPELLRPFLSLPKQQIVDYAKLNGLQWREDETNNDTKYLRNKIRLDVVPKMSPQARSQWLQILAKTEEINKALDKELEFLLHRGLHKGRPVLNRHWFTMLPHKISTEVLYKILVDIGAHDLNRKNIERLTVHIKTVPHGKKLQAAGVSITLTKRSARFRLHSNNT